MKEDEIAQNEYELCKKARRIFGAFVRNYIPLLAGGVTFFGIGAFLTVLLIMSMSGAIVLVQMIIISVLALASLGFGVYITVYSLKRIIPYLLDLRVLKFGKVSTARIAGSDSMAIQGRYAWKRRVYYSFDLRFYDSDGEKRCKTLHYYNDKQHKYLQKIRSVKVKCLNGRAVIIEALPQ